MRAVYQQLAAQPGYQRWRKHGPIYATWDDHDYGENDAGVEYPMKEESAAIFYDFFAVPEDSPRRSRPGIYAVHRIDAPVGRIHLILLDTRWFRGPLQRRPTRPEDRGPYVAAVDPDVPLLGEAQWMWLAEVLEEPADWRVLVSSIQIIPEEHHWEKWANLPGERERLFGLLRERRVEGVLFLSGDRHHGEISRRENPGGHPLYEVTASGMNCARRRPSSEPNRHRVGEMVAEDHFGLMVFRGRGSSAVVDLQLRDIRGHVIAGQRVRREDLTR
jgi:alkaline phosphatase D